METPVRRSRRVHSAASAARGEKGSLALRPTSSIVESHVAEAIVASYSGRVVVEEVVVAEEEVAEEEVAEEEVEVAEEAQSRRRRSKRVRSRAHAEK